MAKPRFFIKGIIGDSVDITGSDARHIKDILRLVPGEIIEVVDSEGTLADVRLEDVSRECVSGRVVERRKTTEALPHVVLFQGLPKSGKFDTVVRQTTEIGVSGISPVLTERVVVKLEPGKAGKKSDRWQRIAEEAAKQAHRMLIPKVSGILSWQEAIEELQKFDQVIVFWEEERESLLFEVLKPGARTIAVVVGPEGGLSTREVDELKEIGARTVTLGESILRTETAGSIAVALVLYELRRLKKLGDVVSYVD